eukprot:m.106445 g.106445  ORF g.106445 m.106445 type:complete len:94 (-) comp22540_c0_seq4:1133-1414(-)
MGTRFRLLYEHFACEKSSLFLSTSPDLSRPASFPPSLPLFLSLAPSRSHLSFSSNLSLLPFLPVPSLSLYLLWLFVALFLLVHTSDWRWNSFV